MRHARKLSLIGAVEANRRPVDFVCIGFARDLASELNSETVQVIENIHFFDALYARGLIWYENRWMSEMPLPFTLRGDATASYLESPLYLRRMKEYNPSLRVIVSAEHATNDQLRNVYQNFPSQQIFVVGNESHVQPSVLQHFIHGGHPPQWSMHDHHHHALSPNGLVVVVAKYPKRLRSQVGTRVVAHSIQEDLLKLVRQYATGDVARWIIEFPDPSLELEQKQKQSKRPVPAARFLDFVTALEGRFYEEQITFIRAASKSRERGAYCAAALRSEPFLGKLRAKLPRSVVQGWTSAEDEGCKFHFPIPSFSVVFKSESKSTAIMRGLQSRGIEARAVAYSGEDVVLVEEENEKNNNNNKIPLLWIVCRVQLGPAS